jgi:hypothetical protein
MDAFSRPLSIQLGLVVVVFVVVVFVVLVEIGQVARCRGS